MRQHESLPECRNGRYLNLAIGLRVLAVGTHCLARAPTVYLKPYGGTWLGCTSRAGLREPRIRPSFRRRLTGEKVRCPIRDACAALTRVGAKFNGEQARLDQKLFTAMTRRSAKLDKLRRDRRLRTILEIWPVAHTPLSFALLATLIAHMDSVFYY